MAALPARGHREGIPGDSMSSTLILIAFWILVQAVPLLVVWITYKITPNQRVQAEGPLSGLNFKIVGALAAWIATMAVMTNYSDSVFAFIINDQETNPKKKWTIEGNLMMVGRNGELISVVSGLKKDAFRITMDPDTYRIENGKLELDIVGEDLPSLKTLFITYGSDESGRPAAEGFHDYRPLIETESGRKLIKSHNLVRREGDDYILRLPQPIILRQSETQAPSRDTYNVTVGAPGAPASTAPPGDTP